MSVHELERQVKDLGKQIEVKIYTDADHAFFNDTRRKSITPKLRPMRGSAQSRSFASIYQSVIRVNLYACNLKRRLYKLHLYSQPRGICL